MLQCPFEEQEIWPSLQACGGDKANGPDGYTMALFKHYWEVVNTEFITTIQNFHERDIFERNFNATYVALIPKKVGAKELKVFWPIILIGSMNKII